MRLFFLLLLLTAVQFVPAQGPMMVQPKLLSQRPPEYPADAQRLRVEGKVLLNARIGTDGTVKGTEFAQALFNQSGKQYEVYSITELDQIAPAIRATARSLVQNAQKSALLWKFTPAKLNGSAVEATIIIPFTFKLTVVPNTPPAPALKKKK